MALRELPGGCRFSGEQGAEIGLISILSPEL